MVDNNKALIASLNKIENQLEKLTKAVSKKSQSAIRTQTINNSSTDSNTGSVEPIYTSAKGETLSNNFLLVDLKMVDENKLVFSIETNLVPDWDAIREEITKLQERFELTENKG